ncbi:MAG: hypothetical protein WD535_01065, partial [Thermaerobacterales bacterium]
LSGDIYRYVWDAHVFTSGINPYLYPPEDPALAHLRDDAIFPEVGLPWLPTPYFPLAQAFFGGAYLLVPDSVTMIKIGLAAADLAAIALLLVLTSRLGRSPAWVALYAWHPLLLIEVAHSGHVDGLLLPLMVLAMGAAALLRKPGWTGLCLGLAVLIKPYALFLAPAFWQRWDWRLPAVLAGTVLAGLLAFGGPGGQWLWDGTVFGSAPYLAAHASFNPGSIWAVVGWLATAAGIEPGTAVRAAGLALLGAAGLWVIVFAPDLSQYPDGAARMAGLARRGWILAAAFWLSTQQMHPWYLLLGLPLLAFYAPRWAVAFSGLIMLSYLNYHFDPWRLPLWVRTLEYLPVYLLLAWELPQMLRRRGAGLETSLPSLRGSPLPEGGLKP